MFACWKLNQNAIAGSNHAAGAHDRHDAGLADDLALARAVENGVHQASPKIVDLPAGSAQAGHFDNGARAEVEQRPARQGEQVHSARRDVLAKIARPNAKALSFKFAEQFRMDEMSLPQIGLARIFRDARAMPYGHPAMRVIRDAKALNEAYL